MEKEGDRGIAFDENRTKFEAMLKGSKESKVQGRIRILQGLSIVAASPVSANPSRDKVAA